MTDTGVQYQLNILPVEPAQLQAGLLATRAEYRTEETELASVPDQMSMMKDIRNTMDAIQGSLAFVPFSLNFYDYENLDVVVYYTIRDIIIAACAVFGLLIFLLTSFWCALVMIFVITMMFIEFVGILSLLSVDFNSYTMLPFLVLMALSVNFHLQIMQGFMKSYGRRYKRSQYALKNMGGIVVDIGVVSILEVLFLSSCQTYEYVLHTP